MTYPPQQPGQGGWGQPQYGQPPGGQFPPGGPQPVPGGQYPPSGPQPVPAGQYPPGGPQYGQPPGGQFPPSGPQAVPGGQVPPGPGGPYPPGGGPGLPGQPWGPQPKKKGSPLPWILGGGALVVLVVIVVVAVVAFTGGPGDPKPTAQAFVDKVNAKDFGSLATLACAKDRSKPSVTDPLGQIKHGMESGDLSESDKQQIIDSMQFHLRVDSVQTVGSKTATAHVSGDMTMSFMGQSKTVPWPAQDGDLGMVVENGAWKICDN
jgi:hypothetical protein